MSRTKAIIFIVLGILLISACNGPSTTSIKLAPVSDLPDAVKQSPATVQEAYRFALTNQDLLEQIPCYCGCGGVGHSSNFACYVADKNIEGEIEFDYHALG